ncbi:hypothetical protein Tco_0954623 [Tanacetum coccineum]|uniref:Uncharacterized protein n=1 Tax=Tanacetum coccineum TaxID=301880 RepID=A0ABQ5E4Y4_9ASTR
MNDNQTGQFGNQRTVTVAEARETETKTGKRLCLSKGEDDDVQVGGERYNPMMTIMCLPLKDSIMSNLKPLMTHMWWKRLIVMSFLIPRICDNEEQADQNAEEYEDERVKLANLIENLKLDHDENKKILKQLKKANASLTHELNECKSALEESNDIRDRCRSALHDQEIELEKYKKYENCQLEKEEVERKLKDTLGLLAQQIFQSDEALKTQAFENFQFKEKNTELVHQSSLEHTRYDLLRKEKEQLKKDFKIRQDKDIEKLIALEHHLEFLNDIVYKTYSPVPSSYTGRFHCGNGTAKNQATVLAGSIGLHWPIPSWQWNRQYRATCFGEFLNRRSCADFCIRDQASRFTCSKYLSSHEDLTTDLKSSFTIIVNQNEEGSSRMVFDTLTLSPESRKGLAHLDNFFLRTSLNNLLLIRVMLSKHDIAGNKDHPNACLCYMLYCLTIGKPFNLAHYIAKRMESVTKTDIMTLPYRMLLTRLFELVCISHPFAITDNHYLVDHMMIPLSEKQVFKITPKGKRPHPQTPTPTDSSESPSPTPHQEEENDLVKNYTLDPIPYIDQLPPIEGGESPEYKQTKGMFKCFGPFLSNLGKKKNFEDLGTKAAAAYSVCRKTGSFEPIEPKVPVLQRAFACFELTSLDDLPSSSSNPPPPSLSQGHSQGLSQTLPQQTPMDFEPSFPPINLSRSRMSAQPEPFLSREQVMQELSQYQDFDHHLEAAIQNVQNVQNSLLPPFTTTFPQIPPPFHYTTTSTTTIPPFRTSLPPSSTFFPLDQSLRRSSIPQPQEYTCPHCQLVPFIWEASSFHEWNWMELAPHDYISSLMSFISNLDSQFPPVTLAVPLWRSYADFCIRDQALRFTCSKYLSSHEDLTIDLKSSFTIIVNQNILVYCLAPSRGQAFWGIVPPCWDTIFRLIPYKGSGVGQGPNPSSSYNGRPSFVNPKYLKKAQSRKPCLYKVLYDKDDIANIFAPNCEETLNFEQESFLPTQASLSKSRHAFNVVQHNIIIFKTIIDLDWEKRMDNRWQQPITHEIIVLVKNLIIPLAIKTKSNANKFKRALKQEMFEDLECIHSLEKEVDELQSEKAEFSNEYDLLLKECVSKDIMYSILHSFESLDVKTEMQCLYLEKYQECEDLRIELSN